MLWNAFQAQLAHIILAEENQLLGWMVLAFVDGFLGL
jgi:hypothetical protein